MGPKRSSIMTSAKPMMADSGVRTSWLILARKSDFWALASSAARFAEVSSRSARLKAVMSRSTAQNFRSGPSLTWPMVIKSGMVPP